MIASNVVASENLNYSSINQTRDLEGFDGVALEGVGEVNIHTGKEYKVIVTTDKNLQDDVITKVDGNTLYIDQKSKNINVKRIFNSEDMTIDVYMPELKNVSLAGLGNIKIHDGNTSELEISLSGAGNIDAQNYQVKNAKVTNSGTGEIIIWATETLNCELTGTGNINAKNNPVKNANVTVSGIGDITIWVTETLTGTLSGVGSINYKGTPIKDVDISGVGTISPL